MHLQLNEVMLSLAQSRESVDGRLHNTLVEAWRAFCLGSVASDYQTICGIPRPDTHFYTMPPQSRRQGRRNMLAQFPQLYPGESLRSDQAAFIAAYLVHLRLDLNWHYDVVLPYFANSSIVGNLRKGYLLHVILLTYLDDLAVHSLPETVPEALANATYEHWLPFAEKDQLDAWREFLLKQLAPGATIRTVKIFAERLRMTPDEFTDKLNDRDWMNRELFSRIPVSKIQHQLTESIVECFDLVEAYWYGRFD